MNAKIPRFRLLIIIESIIGVHFGAAIAAENEDFDRIVTLRKSILEKATAAKHEDYASKIPETAVPYEMIAIEGVNFSWVVHTDATWLGFRIDRPVEVPSAKVMDQIWNSATGLTDPEE